MKANRIMLDLETLGTRPGSVILSIGAVRFDERAVLGTFYERVDARDAQNRGLSIDADTVLWWMAQSPEARAEIAQPGWTLPAVLEGFTAWAGEVDELWGNGASFDPVLLAAAYHVCGAVPPWQFWRERCFRTLKETFPDFKPVRAGTHHNALDDAMHQATWLLAIEQAREGAISATS